MRHRSVTYRPVDGQLGCLEAFQRWREATDNFVVLAWAAPWGMDRMRPLQAAADEVQRRYLAWCQSLSTVSAPALAMPSLAAWSTHPWLSTTLRRQDPPAP